MTKIEELRKAIEEACGTGDALLKSQMGFDFGATTTPNPHHAAYARRNASGTVSQIQAKGAPAPEHHAMVKELHDAFERHDRRGRGGLGISTDHSDYSTPEKYLQTAKNILKYQGHERLGERGADEVGGMLNRHITRLEEGKEGTAAHEAQESPAQEAKEHDEKDEQPVVVQEVKVDAGYRIPPPPPMLHGRPDTRHQKYEEGKTARTTGKPDSSNPYTEESFENMAWYHGWSGDTKADGSPIDNPYPNHQRPTPATGPSPEVAHLITQVEEAATGLLTHAAMQPHRAEIEQMIRELKQYPSAGHAKAIVERLKDMGEEAKEAEPKPHDHYGVEGHGQKGMQNKPWRKTFASADHLDKWAERNDATVHAQRDLERSEAHPQSKGARR